jgi:hypothetical protein
MKNQKIFFLTVLLISVLSCTKDEYNDLFSEPENYRLTKALTYSNSTDSEPNTYIEYKYSEDGNLWRELFYTYPLTLFTYREYDFDSNNQLIEKRIYDGPLDNIRLGTYRKYEYGDGNLIKEELYLADGTLKRTEYYEYDGENLVNQYKVDDKLGIHHQYKYTYNDLDLLILEESFMYDQELSSFTKYSYDDNLRMIKTEIFNHDETITQTIEHKYAGSSTLPSEEIYYDSNGNLTQRRQLIYDDFENLTETKIITDQGSNTLFKKKFKGKLLIEYITYAPTFGFTELTVTRYEYEKIK